MAYRTQQEVISVNDGGDTVTTTRRVAPAAVPDQHPQTAYHQKKAIFKTYQVIWYVVGLIEFILIFRFLFRLLGANPASGFVNLIYGLSAPLIAPFVGIFRTAAGGANALEWSTLIAMAIYAILAYGLEQLLQLVKPTTPEEVEQAVDSRSAI